MIYTYAAALIVGLAVGFAGAWKTQDWRYGAKEAARLSAIAQAEKSRDKASYAAATTFEKGRTHVETVFQTITETVEVIVDRPVYSATTCFDADGVQALRAAIGETAAPSTSGAVPAVERD